MAFIFSKLGSGACASKEWLNLKISSASPSASGPRKLAGARSQAEAAFRAYFADRRQLPTMAEASTVPTRPEYPQAQYAGGGGGVA
jgi:hypothetical protein